MKTVNALLESLQGVRRMVAPHESLLKSALGAGSVPPDRFIIRSVRARKRIHGGAPYLQGFVDSQFIQDHNWSHRRIFYHRYLTQQFSAWRNGFETNPSEQTSSVSQLGIPSAGQFIWRDIGTPPPTGEYRIFFPNAGFLGDGSFPPGVGVPSYGETSYSLTEYFFSTLNGQQNWGLSNFNEIEPLYNLARTWLDAYDLTTKTLVTHPNGFSADLIQNEFNPSYGTTDYSGTDFSSYTGEVLLGGSQNVSGGLSNWGLGGNNDLSVTRCDVAFPTTNPAPRYGLTLVTRWYFNPQLTNYQDELTTTVILNVGDWFSIPVPEYRGDPYLGCQTIALYNPIFT